MIVLHNPARLVGFTASTLMHILSEPELQGKKGGVFCAADLDGRPLTISFVGSVPEEKAEKYWRLAQEKASRLAKNQEHLSSWQSRDGVEKWGGAVRAERNIFSFSGLPELWDEALMLMVAYDSSSFPPNDGFPSANRIASLSNNMPWQTIKKHMGYGGY